MTKNYKMQTKINRNEMNLLKQFYYSFALISLLMYHPTDCFLTSITTVVI